MNCIKGSVLAVALAVSVGGSAVAGEYKCETKADLKKAFSIVFPNAKQVTMERGATEAYLAEYNRFGRPTEIEGDELFMNILPNGTTMLLPMKDGVNCHRFIAGPKLHKVIMMKVARGAI